MTSFRAAVAVAVLSSFPAFASITFRGDFETGDLTQWSSVEAANPAHLLVVPSPVAQGRFAMQVTVAPGEMIYNGNRNELDYDSNPSEGDERWYQFDTLFPADFQSANTWQAFCQFHQYVAGGSPPVWFQVVGEQLRLGTSSPGGTDSVLWNTPLVRGVWHQFTLHVRWSSDSAVGFLELYYDGQLAMAKRSTATLFPGDTVYLKEGLYRDSSIGFTQTLYEDGMVEATSASDLQIGSVGTSDAGTPPPPPPVTVDGGTDAGTPPPTDAGTPPPTDAGTPTATDGGSTSSGSGPGADPLTPGNPNGQLAGVSGGCAEAGSGGVGVMTLLLLWGLLFGALRRRRRASNVG